MGGILLALLGACAVAKADIFDVDRTPDNHLILSSASCGEMPATLAALRTWTESLNQAVGPLPPLSQSADSCSADITQSVPEQVRIEQEQGTAFDGPNCWNTALRTRGLVQAVRFSADTEMTFWMNSPYCHQLTDAEAAQPGDIIALRSYETAAETTPVEVHGMVYVTPDLVYSKNSSTHDDPYALQRADFVYSDFQILACLKIYGRNAKCFSWGNYFRCTDPSADRALALKSDAQLNAQAQTLSVMESSITAFVQSGQPQDWNTPDQYTTPLNESDRAILAQIQALQKTTSALASQEAKSRLFFWQSLHQQALSLLAQLRMIQHQRSRPTAPAPSTAAAL